MPDSAASVLFVTEIFRSIQGESTLAGRPCVFVRLSGCNLRCRYCDTTYAYEPGAPLAIAAILARVAALGGALVEVTGGEPLLQAQTPALLDALADAGLHVLLETNGSIPLPPHRRCRVIMDLKCPSSGESAHMDWANLARLQAGDEIKFVVGERADFDWAVATVHAHRLAARDLSLLVGPVARSVAPAALAAWILDSGLDLRLHLPLHRIIWPDRDRGV